MNNTYMRQLESTMAEMAYNIGIKDISAQIYVPTYTIYSDLVECWFLHRQIHVVCTYSCTGHIESDAKNILCSCLLKVAQWYTDAIRDLQILSPSSGEAVSMEEVSR